MHSECNCDYLLLLQCGCAHVSVKCQPVGNVVKQSGTAGSHLTGLCQRGLMCQTGWWFAGERLQDFQGFELEELLVDHCAHYSFLCRCAATCIISSTVGMLSCNNLSTMSFQFLGAILIRLSRETAMVRVNRMFADQRSPKIASLPTEDAANSETVLNNSDISCP